MHHIFVHKVAIQVLCFFIILLFTLCALLVDYSEPIKRTYRPLFQVAA
jgi:hypothetical protein